MNRHLIILTALFLLTLTACSQNKKKSGNSQKQETYELLAPSDFQKRMMDDPGILIDVRTKNEINKGMLAGAIGLDIFSDDFDSELNKLDKSKTYYVYCAAGGRSLEACEIMQKKGFVHVVDLDGGYKRWTREGLPINNPQPAGN